MTTTRFSKLLHPQTGNFMSASMLTMLGVMFANAGAFFFSFIMARFLQPADFAILISLISLFGLLTIPSAALQMVIVRMTAEAKSRENLAKVTEIYHFFLRQFVIISIVLLAAYFAIGQAINKALHIADPRLLLLLVLTVVLYYFIILYRSLQQGMFTFTTFAITNFLEMVFRIIFAVVLAFIGFAVVGGIASFTLALIIVLAYSMYSTKRYLPAYEAHAKLALKEAVRFAAPALFLLVGINSFYTLDILLVKHFFPEDIYPLQAALYSGVSTIGKIIYFGVFGITSALLPIATARFSKGEKTLPIFLLSFGLALAYCIVFIAIDKMFPQYVLLLLGHADYQQAKTLLSLFALFIASHALVFLCANYLYSLRKTAVCYIVFLAALVQVILIVTWHQSLQIVVVDSFMISLILLILLLAYIRYSHKSVA